MICLTLSKNGEQLAKLTFIEKGQNFFVNFGDNIFMRRNYHISHLLVCVFLHYTDIKSNVSKKMFIFEVQIK